MPESDLDLLPIVAKIVSAHVANNVVMPADLPPLIDGVYAALCGLGKAAEAAGADNGRQPAVPIKKSVFKDYIVCLEDGRKLKTLRRHLKGAFGLTPEAYRERWGLAPDYQMVAPDYAAQRSSLAKAAGLGKLGRQSTAAAEEAEGPVIQRVPEGVSGKKYRRKAA